MGSWAEWTAKTATAAGVIQRAVAALAAGALLAGASALKIVGRRRL